MVNIRKMNERCPIQWKHQNICMHVCIFVFYMFVSRLRFVSVALALSLSLSLVSFTSYDSLCFASDDEISEIRFFSHLLFFHITDEYQLVNTIHWEIFYL